MSSSERGEVTPQVDPAFGLVARALREGFPLIIAKNKPGIAVGRIKAGDMQDAIQKQGFPKRHNQYYSQIETGVIRPPEEFVLLYIAATARALDLSPAKMELMLRAYKDPDLVRSEEVETVWQGEELPELADKQYEKMLLWVKNNVTTPEIAKQISLQS